MLLGVNIDHVATLRQARNGTYPNPVECAMIAEIAGADYITLHLREDRRHIQDDDVLIMRRALKTRMNLEMAVTDEMLGIALQVRPHDTCLVPERRAELTTEGGLDVAANVERIATAVKTLSAAGIRVSLFIDPDRHQIDAAHKTGAPLVELHTGAYAGATDHGVRAAELDRIRIAARHAHDRGLHVNAGHGLNYQNVQPVAAIAHIRELNIGHAIIAQALVVGLAAAVRDMKALILAAR